MKWWMALIIGIVLTLVFRFGVTTTVVTDSEVDALRSGVLFGKAMSTSDGGLKHRLIKAFASDREHPRVKEIIGGGAKRNRRRLAAQGPISRWVAGLGMSIFPGATPAEKARWPAALLMAWATLLFAWRFREHGWPCVIAGLGLFLMVPGVLEAGSTYGAVAASMALMGLLHSQFIRFGSGRGFWMAGACVGLLMGVYPGTAFLFIPMFILVALRLPRGPRQGSDDSPRSGRLSLPLAPVSLFVAPLIGLITLLVVWPALWRDTGAQLGNWFGEGWREYLLPQNVDGVVYDQRWGRSPPVYASFFQWLGLLTPPLLLGWFWGLVTAIRKGREGNWEAILVVVCLLLVAGFSGGLWNARVSVWGLLLFPTLMTVMDGYLNMVERLKGVDSWSTERAARVAFGIVIGVNSLFFLTGFSTGGPNGIETQHPIPTEIIRQAVGSRLGPRRTPISINASSAASTRDAARWKYNTWVLASYADLPVRLVSASQADVVLMAPTYRTTQLDEIPEVLGQHADLEVQAGGLSWRVFTRQR
jgi:hypothetical protein